MNGCTETVGPRQRILRIGCELLRDVLRLPESAKIVGVNGDLYFEFDQIALKIEHPEFSPGSPGDAIPEVDATYELRGDVPVFVGWRDA